MSLTKRLFCCLTLAILAPLAPPAVPAADVVVATEVRRPAREFLDYGDVIGVAPDLLTELGIKEGDPVRVEASMGTYIGVHTKILGTNKETIFAKKTIRDSLGIEDGGNHLLISAIEWSPESPLAETVTFSNVERPPLAFLIHGDAVGVSLRRMMELGAKPGMTVFLQSANGSTRANIQLLDRGYDTIVMKETIRESLNIPEGPARVTMKVLGEMGDGTRQTTPLYWYNTFSSAQQRAKDEGRPILVYVESTGGDGSDEFENLLNNDSVKIALLKARKHRFVIGDNTRLQSQLKVTKAPTVLFLTPDLQEISRFEEIPTADQMVIANNEALTRIEKTVSTVTAPVRWHPYNIAQINQTLSDHGKALIYVRLDVAENCAEFERTYLFGDAGNKLLGGKDGYFFDAGKSPLLANQFKVAYAPTVILLKSDGSHEKLEVTKNTNPGTILEFFRRLDAGK